MRIAGDSGWGRTFSIENPSANNGVCMTAWQMNPRRVAASDAGDETGSEAFSMEAGGTSVRRELEVRPAGMRWCRSGGTKDENDAPSQARKIAITMRKAEQSSCVGIASRIKRGLSTFVAVASCGVLVAGIMMGLCCVVLYQSRQDALDHTRDTLRDIAVIAQRDIERNLELYELSLQAVVDGLQQPDVMILPPHLRREVLFDRAASAKYLGSMLVMDALGNVVIDSGSDTPRAGNFSDREYFKVQRDNPNASLYISDP